MDLDIDKLEAFFEATEDWNTAMNMSNSMAFISQFGVSCFVVVIVEYAFASHTLCVVSMIAACRSTTPAVAKTKFSNTWRNLESKSFWQKTL